MINYFRALKHASLEDAWIKAKEEMRPRDQRKSNPNKSKKNYSWKVTLSADEGQHTQILVDILMEEKIWVL